MKNYTIVMILGLIILGVITLYSWNYFKIPEADIIVYSFECSNEATSLDDCQNARKASYGRVAYKINIDQGEIISWFPDLETSNNNQISYDVSKDCLITDTKNWSCDKNSYGMKDGKYFEIGLYNMVSGSFFDWFTFSQD